MIPPAFSQRTKSREEIIRHHKGVVELKMKIYKLKKDHVNQHNQFRPNRGTVVALKMKIYKRKKDHVKRHNPFRPNRGTIVELKMRNYKWKKDHVNQHK